MAGQNMGDSTMAKMKKKSSSSKPLVAKHKASSQGKKVRAAKGKRTPTTVQPAAEKVVYEPEPVGEDDHAFFDDEENEDYAKFMIALNKSNLTTFTKRTKDRVTSAPTKKSQLQHEETHPAEEHEPSLPTPQSNSSPSESNVDVFPEPKTLSKRQIKSAVDAKRRKASTAGWVEEDTGPQRLPIKTRRGILKPNERMMSTLPPSDDDKGEKITTIALDRNGDVDNPSAVGNGHPVMGNSGNDDMEVSDDVESLSGVSEISHNPMTSDMEEDEKFENDGGNPGSLQKTSSSGKVDLAVLRQRRFLQKKEDMAELCEAILGAPEESLARSKDPRKGEEERSRMEQLAALVEDDDHRVRHLAVLSQFAVFKDIIPTYRIRVPTAAELATKVSKDVHRARMQEAAFLRAYQQYLKALEAVIQAASPTNEGRSSELGARSLAATAIRCMCGLLSAHPYFNFRSNLIRTVVAGTNHKMPEVRETCCQCLGDVFAKDVQGEVSLEATKAIAKYAKDRKFQVSEGTVRCLSILPLRVREDERARAKARVKNKNRKRRKEGSVEAGLAEADARVDEDLHAKTQGDALHEVMLTYFRVLKRRPPPPNLFPAVMEGLAKFVHLVNLDTVQDLLDLLRDLLVEGGDAGVLPLKAALHCILASFRALQGPGRELQTDEGAFISALYRRLPDLSQSAASGDISRRQVASCVSLVYECLDAALGKRRELSTARVAALVKRLLSVALQLPQSASPAWGAGAGGLLRGAHRLLLRYQAAQQLLENEQDRPGAGPFKPHLDNPEHANALSSAAWELSVLRHSCDPAIAAAVRDIVALSSQDAASALATLHERGREARESGAGQGTLEEAFAGVPPPEGRAVALERLSSEVENGGLGGKGQQRKRSLPRSGVDTKSALLVRLARTDGETATDGAHNALLKMYEELQESQRGSA